jgi:membrane-associated phospholipid phosphatase
MWWWEYTVVTVLHTWFFEGGLGWLAEFFAYSLDVWILVCGGIGILVYDPYLHLHWYERKEFLLRARYIFWTVGIGIIAWGLVALLKYLFSLPRPYTTLMFDSTLISPWISSTASFPSGHALVLTALCCALMLSSKKLGILLFIASLCVFIGRIAVGIHFPLDILAGIFLGILVVFVGKKGLGKLPSHN